MKNNFLIGIPTFNEEASILDVLKRISHLFQRIIKAIVISVLFFMTMVQLIIPFSLLKKTLILMS